MLVRNKWNKKIYFVVEKSKGKVKLEREDFSQFEISESEFNFSYTEETNEKEVS